MPYVIVKQDLDRIKMIEEMILVDPNQFLAIMRTTWNGGVGLNVHRPATSQEKVEAFEIIRQQMSFSEELRATAAMKVRRRLTARLSDPDEL